MLVYYIRKSDVLISTISRSINNAFISGATGFTFPVYSPGYLFWLHDTNNTSIETLILHSAVGWIECNDN